MIAYAKYSKADNLVDSEDKPKLLLKVYEAIMDRLDIVRIMVEKKDFEKKYVELSKVTNVLEILDASLDMSMGEIPKHLSDIYRYIVKRLNEAHRSCDVKILDECRHLIENIHEGFLKAYEKESENRRVKLHEPLRGFESSMNFNITT